MIPAWIAFAVFVVVVCVLLFNQGDGPPDSGN